MFSDGGVCWEDKKVGWGGYHTLFSTCRYASSYSLKKGLVTFETRREKEIKEMKRYRIYVDDAVFGGRLVHIGVEGSLGGDDVSQLDVSMIG